MIVAIRDTQIDHKNPYSTIERWNLIQKALHKYADLVKIIVIPDIDEICYGRDVGYAIRKIDLDAKTESVSGTKTRKKHSPTHTILWLTGQSGAGKTTLATALSREIGAVVLDGDEMRESISLGSDFSQMDRHEHNLRVARLALVLAKQNPIIVSVIAPFEETRDAVETIIKPIWIYVQRELPQDKNKPYEIPVDPPVVVNSDKQTTEQQVATVLHYLHETDITL